MSSGVDPKVLAEKLGITGGIDPTLHRKATKMAAKFYKQVCKDANQTPEYKLMMRRRYRDVKGYISWKNLAARMCVELLGTQHLPAHMLELDFAKSITLPNYYYQIHKNGSAWWLSKDLGKALLDTDIQENVLSINKVTTHGLILLPQGLLQTPEGEPVEFICFSHAEPGDLFQDVTLGKKVYHFAPSNCAQIMSATTTRGGTTYVSSVKLGSDNPGEVIERGQWKPNPLLSAIDNPDVEQTFLRKVDNLTIQSLLLFQSYPKLVESEGASRPQIGKARRTEDRWLKPNWLGQNFRRERSARKTLDSGKGTGQPVLHRRGHWRYLNAEEQTRWKSSRWVWVRPVEPED